MGPNEMIRFLAFRTSKANEASPRRAFHRIVHASDSLKVVKNAVIALMGRADRNGSRSDFRGHRYPGTTTLARARAQSSRIDFASEAHAMTMCIKAARKVILRPANLRTKRSFIKSLPCGPCLNVFPPDLRLCGSTSLRPACSRLQYASNVQPSLSKQMGKPRHGT